jgi:hypothetical protein
MPRKLATDPPQPPEVKERFRLPLIEAIGMAILAILPILALFGIFEPKPTRVELSNQDLKAEITYPTRLRYKLKESLEVKVTNASQQAVDEINVAIDEEYLKGFSPKFHPVPQADVGVMKLRDIGPGETAVARVELEAEEYGTHRGAATVSQAGMDVIATSISTFVIP